jgi:hypothetical protein
MASRLGPAKPRGNTWNGAGAWLIFSAVSAGELLAHVLHHLPLPRHHLQRLSDILAELGKSGRTAAGACCRTRHEHALARQMRRERLACRLAAPEGAHLRALATRCCGLLGRDLVLGGRRFQLLERKLHLVEQTRLALVARSKQIALELLDRQSHLRDQGLRARCFGTRLRKLRVALQQQALERIDVVGQRIIRIHRAGWNHKLRVL